MIRKVSNTCDIRNGNINLNFLLTWALIAREREREKKRKREGERERENESGNKI